MDIDRFLNFWNVIDSLDGVRGDLVSLVRRRGRGVGIAFACPDAQCGGTVERALARYAIPIWGRRVTGLVDVGGPEPWRGFSLRTEANRADWTRYIIWRLGCHVIDDPNPDNARWAARHTDLPPAWRDNARRIGRPVKDNARRARLLRELW